MTTDNKQFSLEAFESAAYSRRHEEAAQHLVVLLDSLNRNYGSLREQFSAKLHEFGIGNDVYYPTQVHKLPSFNLSIELPETEIATREVLSLPVHPGLSKKDLKRIASSFNSIYTIIFINRNRFR